MTAKYNEQVALVKQLEASAATLGTQARDWKAKYEQSQADLIVAQSKVGTTDSELAPLTAELTVNVQKAADDVAATSPTN